MKDLDYNYKHHLILVLFSFFLSPVYAILGKYPIQNFSTSEYKAGIQNIDFAQNRDMGIFVANNLGVLSFDGNEWNVNAYKTGKKQRSLAFDANENLLYVGSQGDFGYFKENWNYVSLLDKIPTGARDFDEVWDVFVNKGKVYFCTFQGIYVYDGESIQVVKHKEGLDRTFYVEGKLFTQNPQGKLFEIKENQLIAIEQQQQADQIIAGLIVQEEGYLLIYNSGTIELATYFGVSEKHRQLSDAIKGKYVNHVLQLSDTRLVISTQTAGLFIYDLNSEQIENITSQDGLMSNACLRSFQDHTGNLWVGLQNGIAAIGINSPIRFINQDINLQGSGYESFERAEGIYYTTSNGIYFLAAGAPTSNYLVGTEGPAYGMQEIAGKLYAGHHSGLFLLENGLAKRIAYVEGLWQVKQLRLRPEYAIGGTYAGLYLFRINASLVLQPLRKLEGFDESSRFFEEDQKGRIWVGQFYKGLYQLDLNEDLSKVEVKKVSDDYDLPIKEKLILSRINNELFLATNAGIYQLDQTTDQIIEANMFTDVIGKQPVDLLIQDAKKNIYVFAEHQVASFKQISSNNFTPVSSSLFQLRYSFNNDLLHASVNTRNGVIFNANEGFIHYNPELEDRTRIESAAMVNKIYSVLEDSVLYVRKPFATRRADRVELQLSPKAKVLQFKVASFRFQDINHQQFRYLLEGFDPTYSQWTDASTKEYTNLQAGSYTFRVQSRNHLGEITTSEPVVLEVSPPFYKSGLAIFLYLLLGLLMIWLLLRLQKQDYKRRAIKMEAVQQLALAQKQHELLAIQKQKDQELLQLQEDKMKGELQHLNSLLAASTMNIVAKNELIETIKAEIKTVKQNGKSAETKKALEKLVKNIDFTLRLQEDWEQFKIHFDQVHGDFLSRLRHEFHDLSPNDQKLSAFLRLNLDTKEIANLMGISTRGIEVARYRLRKKLGLGKGENLSKFMLDY